MAVNDIVPVIAEEFEKTLASALITVDAALIMLQDTDTTDAERHAAGIEVALELVSA